MEDIQISKVDESQAEHIKEYVKAFRIGLFPMLDPAKVPQDITAFTTTYITSDTGTFLQAKDSSGNIIGVIGMMPYDYRFDYLDYKDKKTVEVARLFVEPPYRRTGLATRLFNALLEVAQQKGIDMLYLHTHPFLTGAFEYWQKQGFKLITTSIDGDFTTLHMDRLVNLG
ncbi:MAG: GNAT family N-acetyltransferase [Flavobacterium sp.]